MTADLTELGWNERLEAEFASRAAHDLSPGRISAQHRTGYGLLAVGGEYFAEVTGRLSHMALNPAELPVVGDWVAAVLRPGEATATIVDILPRATWFSASMRVSRWTQPRAIWTQFSSCAAAAAARSRMETRSWWALVGPALATARTMLSSVSPIHSRMTTTN